MTNESNYPSLRFFFPYQLSTPENNDKGGLATGDVVITSLHPTSTAIPGRFPEPISEASESLVLHSPPPPSPEVECKLHRRQGSRGVMQTTTQQSPTSKALQPTPTSPSPAFLTPPLKRRREKNFASMCAYLRANTSGKFRGLCVFAAELSVEIEHQFVFNLIICCGLHCILSCMPLNLVF